MTALSVHARSFIPPPLSLSLSLPLSLPPSLPRSSHPQEHLKILYYHPEDEIENRKVRNIGLCEALVNFTKTFRPIRPCEVVHTQKTRQVYFEPEPSIWMILVSTYSWMLRWLWNWRHVSNVRERERERERGGEEERERGQITSPLLTYPLPPSPSPSPPPPPPPPPSIYTCIRPQTASVPWVERAENNEKKIEYLENNVQDPVLAAALRLSYSMFKVVHNAVVKHSQFPTYLLQ